jgi:hypothetical protein
MRYEAIKQITLKPADKVRMMNDEVLGGPLHFQAMTQSVNTNTWLVFRRDQQGKAHSHKYIDGDKILWIDPSNEDPNVVGTNAT